MAGMRPLFISCVVPTDLWTAPGSTGAMNAAAASE